MLLCVIHLLLVVAACDRNEAAEEDRWKRRAATATQLRPAVRPVMHAQRAAGRAIMMRAYNYYLSVPQQL